MEKRQNAGALLVLIPLPSACLAALRERWAVLETPGAAVPDLPQAQRDGIRAVVTNGTTGMRQAWMDALPQLGIVCSFGAGYEGIDVAAARERGIAVTHAPGVNNATVADHAMALLLAAARGLPQLDRGVKAGQWQAHRGARPAVHGKRLGIVGMGNIGGLIARRAHGFDMEIAYHARTARPGLPHRFVDSPVALAGWCDYLVLACPGGPATRHLVDAAVLAALGPQGFLVNVARGSVVDTQALMAALAAGAIAGAALDVLEDEPALPAGAARCERLILTPHMSGRSPEAQAAQQRVLLESLAAWAGGQALAHLVPG